MIHVQPDKQYQLRRACDRCHKAKLRCLRSSEEPCDRCRQVGAACTSSPASRSQRHKNNSGRKTSLQAHAHATTKDIDRAQGRSAADLPITGSFFTQTMMDADRMGSVVGQILPLGMHDISPTDFETLPDFQDQIDQFMLLDSHGLDTSFNLSPDIALSTSNPSPPHQRLHDTQSQAGTPSLVRTMCAAGNSALNGKGMMVSTSASPSTMSTTTDSSLQNSATPPTTPPDQEDVRNAHPIEHAMREMNDFNITLMRYLLAIPIIRPGDDAEELLAAPGAKCPIDEVFLLSEQFIQVSKSLHNSPSPSTYGSQSVSTSLDAASQMTVLSTYLRLIDTYGRILQHVLLHCQQRRDKPNSTGSSSDEAGLKASPERSTLLEWSIGSFSLSSRSTIQQLFMLQLVETMLTQCRRVMDGITSEKANISPREEGDCLSAMSLSIVPDVAVQAIRTREDATMHLVQQIKEYLSP